MSRFEVVIPAKTDDAFDTTVTVTASDWLSALRAALSQSGEALQRGLLCHFQPDHSVRVTDAKTFRSFSVTPLDGTLPPATTPPPPDAPPPDLDPFDTFEMSPSERKQLLARARTSSADLPAITPPSGSPKIISAKKEPSGSHTKLSILPASPSQSVLERVLDQVQWLYERDRSLEQAASAMLSLASELIPCESGAALFPDLQGHVIHFVAAHGPHAPKVLGMSMPAHSGLAGFCMREGVALVVDDASKDHRFHAAISQHLGYATRCVLCAPLLFDGRVYGVLELLNHLHAPTFSFSDLALLSHIGSHLAQYINLQI